MLKKQWFDIPCGILMVVADEKALYFLKFVSKHGIESQDVQKFQIKSNIDILEGATKPIVSIKKELKNYFNGTLSEFKTPLHFMGSDFQKRVWKALMGVPYGQTRSYAMQATIIGQPTAYRAVANANGANPLVIVVPCHRIIKSNGNLGGYSAPQGIAKKQWLLNHEQ